MKQNYLVAFILGLLCSFGQPPFNNVVVALISLGVFFSLLSKIHNDKQRVYFAFFFGYGYFIYSVHWFSDSLLTYGDSLLWLMPFGLTLMPAFFALYFILAGLLIAKFSFKKSFYVAVIWLFVELIRSYVYIEFPWALIGYIWSENKIISQVVSVIGIWGLSFLTVIWACGIVEALKLICIKNAKTRVILVSMISFFSCYIYGIWHLNEQTIAQNIKIMVIQPNIEQNINARIQNSYRNLLDIIQVSKHNNGIDYVIWPEGSNEYSLDRNLLNLIREAVPENGELILSSTRIDRNDKKYWNSLFAINPKGEIIDYYDKIRLVPLGEYIPFRLREWLPFINKITPGDTDYTPGSSIKSIKTKFPFMPSICYEAAFPGGAFDNYTWIVNLTNDGWFGNGIGPYQHLAIAKFRAIELGVPMIRSALTGISAIINSFGQITQHVDLLKKGMIKTEVPSYLKDKTYYRVYENWMVVILIILLYLSIEISKQNLSNKINQQKNYNR